VTRRRLAALAAGLALAVLAGLLSVRTVAIPGWRAGLAGDGFQPLRWDATHRTAREPVTLRFAAAPVTVQLMLSGAGGADVVAGDARVHVTLDEVARAVVVDAPQGVVRLEPQPVVRVHGIEVQGERGTLARLALRVLLARLALPALLVLLLAAMLSPRLLPAVPRAPLPEGRLAVAFGALMLASALAQCLLLPQPLPIGDPGAYYDMAGRVRDAMGAVRSLDDLAQALRTLRPYGGLFATASTYALLRSVSDALQVVYAAHALAMAGAVFFLVRAAARLGGRSLAVTTGTLALLYPPLAVLCGLVQPEPFILLAWCFALDRLLAAHAAGSRRDAAWAGLAFAVGLALHPQGLWFLLAATALVAIPFAPRLLHGQARATTIAFAWGVLPIVVATALGERAARPAVGVLEERYGFWAYTAPMPLGFWLYLETEGWQGPLRLDQTEYGRGFLAEDDAGRMGTAAARALYTARFLAARPGTAVHAVLRNLHRLYAVPDNPPGTDWPWPLAWQKALHAVLVVLCLLAVPLLVDGRGALVFAPIAALAATYPLYHVYNKYAVPSLPFVLLAAAVGLLHVCREKRRGLLIACATAAAVGAWVPASALALHGVPTSVARVLLLSLAGGGLAGLGASALRWAHTLTARAATIAAFALLLAANIAAARSDVGWRDLRVPLDRAPRHEVVLAADAAGQEGASLLLDLDLPDGDPRPLQLVFDGGLVVSGDALTPTMPAFPLATTRQRVRPQSVRQWWSVPFDPRMAPDGRLGLEVRGPAQDALHGALMDREATVDRGLSLGQWPWVSVYRLMHDGEYRLSAEQPLDGGPRRSLVAGRALPGLLGVRVVVRAPNPAAPAGVSALTSWQPVRVF
jgi:hypothetical protein